MKLKQKRIKRREKTQKLRSVSRENSEFKPLRKENSKKNYFLIKNRSTISEMLSKSSFVRKYTNLLVILKKISFFKKDVNSKRTKIVNEFRID
jgi:hypothetical protein